MLAYDVVTNFLDCHRDALHVLETFKEKKFPWLYYLLKEEHNAQVKKAKLILNEIKQLFPEIVNAV